MKNSRQCPTCQSRKLWVISPARLSDEGSGNKVLTVKLAVGIGGVRVEIGRAEAWICAQCGLMQWHMALDDAANVNLANLAHTPNTGVHFVDGTAPYR